jgi:hypothetical protein
MWPCTLKWDDEKSKHVGLAQNVCVCFFGPTFLLGFGEANKRHFKNKSN